MADKIDVVPEHTRWEIATNGLTGAYTAITNAMKEAVGQQKFDEFNGPLWYEAGKGAREFADAHGLATESAEDSEGVDLDTVDAPFEDGQVEFEQHFVGDTSQCPAGDLHGH